MQFERGRNAPSAAEELRKQRKAFEEGDLRPAVRKKQEESSGKPSKKAVCGPAVRKKQAESSGKPSKKAVC